MSATVQKTSIDNLLQVIADLNSRVIEVKEEVKSIKESKFKRPPTPGPKKYDCLELKNLIDLELLAYPEIVWLTSEGFGLRNLEVMVLDLVGVPVAPRIVTPDEVDMTAVKRAVQQIRAVSARAMAAYKKGTWKVGWNVLSTMYKTIYADFKRILARGLKPPEPPPEPSPVEETIDVGTMREKAFKMLPWLSEALLKMEAKHGKYQKPQFKEAARAIPIASATSLWHLTP